MRLAIFMPCMVNMWENLIFALWGDLPKKAQELVRERLTAYQTELQEMWDSQSIKKLPPLQ